MSIKKTEVTKSFAQWTERDHYNVTFNPGTNGKINGSGNIDRYSGQTITNTEVPTVTPNVHYIFKGWNPSFTEHAVTSNETYMAVYEYIAATVHFNTNGGETINDVEVDRGSKIGNINNPRHKDGVFVGWCSDSGLQTTVDLKSWVMSTPATETTFYAKWDKEVVKKIISYVVVGGTASFSTVTKILRDSDGWASTSGSFTLTESDIPTITASQGSNTQDVTWSPRKPTVGDRITDNTVFTATLGKVNVSLNLTLGQNMTLVSGKLTQTLKYGQNIENVVIKCVDGYAWSEGSQSSIASNINPLTAVFSGENNLTISGVFNGPNYNVAFTIPNPEPTINYGPENGNHLMLVSIRESDGSFTNWSQWTSPTSVIPKYDFTKPIRLNYSNLETGGVNAMWAMFGEHPFQNLVTSFGGSAHVSENEVLIEWRFSSDQITLINNHIGEIIMLYDEGSRKSGFCFEVTRNGLDEEWKE